MKKIEYEKINKQKYKTKEIIGQSIDVKHIGTSFQKTFNFPRTQMEMFGYYINSLFHNLDWLKIAKRWETQCLKQETKISTSDLTNNNKGKTQKNNNIKPQHQEL